MSKHNDNMPVGLALAGQRALRFTNPELAALLGISRRTIERWAAGQSSPSPSDLVTIASHVHPIDPELAARIAAGAQTTLEMFGIVPRKAASPAVGAASAAALSVSPPPPVAQLVENIVCAAADAIDVSPRTIRPALYAAFSRAAELGVDTIAVTSVLAPAVSAKPSKPASPREK